MLLHQNNGTQPQAPCSLQAVSEKVQRQLSIGETENLGLDRKKDSNSAQRSIPVAPLGLLCQNWTINKFKRTTQNNNDNKIQRGTEGHRGALSSHCKVAPRGGRGLSSHLRQWLTGKTHLVFNHTSVPLGQWSLHLPTACYSLRLSDTCCRQVGTAPARCPSSVTAWRINSRKKFWIWSVWKHQSPLRD